MKIECCRYAGRLDFRNLSRQNHNLYQGRFTMKKKLVSALLALCFVIGTAGVSMAAKLKCTVDAVDGETVTMTCKKADKLKAGDKVKVTPPKKGGAIEGC